MPIAGAPDGIAGQPAWYMLPRIASVHRARGGWSVVVWFSAPLDPTDLPSAVEWTAKVAPSTSWEPCPCAAWIPGDKAAPACLEVALPAQSRSGADLIRVVTIGQEEQWPIPAPAGEV
jgi:hypothetical protein